jgi:archaellum component FlaG (FlaF/FlaG flagellin family)
MTTDVISSAIIGIATLIIVATLVATLFPQVFEVAGRITSTTGTANDRLRTSATVVNFDNQTSGRLQFDVLNNGETSLAPSAINMTVAYLYNNTMPAGLLVRGVSPTAQYWEYTITGDIDQRWGPGEVLEVRVLSPAYSFTRGDYKLKMLLYNGAVVQYSFTI